MIAMCVVLVRVCSWPWLVEWKLAYKEKMFSEKPVFLLNKNCHSVRLCHSFSFHQNVLFHISCNLQLTSLMCRRYRVTDRWSDPCHFSSCRSLHKKPCWHGFFHMDFSYEKWTKSPLFTLPRSDTSWTRGLSLVSLVGVHTVLRKTDFFTPTHRGG